MKVSRGCHWHILLILNEIQLTGSQSFFTPQLTIPIPNRAPATTWLSLLCKYLSICESPESTSHNRIIPYNKEEHNHILIYHYLFISNKTYGNNNTKLAAALAFPCSLFLNSQLPEDPLEDSDVTVINLS